MAHHALPRDPLASISPPIGERASAFEIPEAPASKIFYGIKPGGDELTPSVQRPPFTWDEHERYRAGVVDYGLLDVPFEELKRPADRKVSGP